MKRRTSDRRHVTTRARRDDTAWQRIITVRRQLGRGSFPGEPAQIDQMKPHRRSWMEQRRQRINMFDPAVCSIRIEGRLGESWLEYFGAQSILVEEDETGRCTTTLLSEPVDQAALVGMINLLNGMGLPLVSVECLPAPVENQPAEQDDA